MRKHFLILMLLALLPFTAWAADLTFKVGETAFTGGTFTSTDLTVTVWNGTTQVTDATWKWSATEPENWADVTAYTGDIGKVGYYQATKGENSGTFVITKATNSISALSIADIQWAASITAPTPTITNAFGTPVYTYSYDNGVNFGAWSNTPELGAYIVKATIAGTDNYTAAEKTATFKVVKANLVANTDFTAPAATGATYDGTFQDLTTAGEILTDNATQILFATSATSTSWSTSVLQAKDADVSTVWYKVKGDAHHNDYGPVQVENAKISKKEIAVTAKNNSISYGSAAVANSDLYTIDGGYSLADVDADNAAVKNSLVNVSWGSYASQPTNAGTYPFTLTAGTPSNYAVTVTSGTGKALTISRVQLAAVVTKPADYVYGAQEYNYNDFTTTFTIVGTENEHPDAAPTSLTYTVEETTSHADYYTYDPTTGAPSVKGDVGTYEVTPVAEFANYEVMPGNITTKTFTVNQAEIANNWITFNKSSFEYAGQSSDLKPTVTVINSYNSKPLVEDVDYTITWPGDMRNAGTKNVKINALSGNYKDKTTKANKSYTITPAPLTIVIKDQEKIWDGAEIAPVRATSTTLDDWAIIYNNLEEAYDVVFSNYPQFEVGIKDRRLNPGLTPATYGWNNIETGSYPITINSDISAPNYDVVIENGTYTVGSAEIIVAAADAEKVYGAADPVLTYKVKIGSTWKTGAAVATYIKTAPTSITRQEGQTPGTYTITCSADAVPQDNFTIKETQNGTFTINKKNLRILADAKNKVYDGKEPTDMTYMPIGLAYNDKVKSVKLVKAAGVNVGKYDITPSDADVDNAAYYNITYQNAKYEIKQRQLTKITVADQSIDVQPGNTDADKNNALASMDKTLVTFEADGYTLSEADYEQLRTEFDFDFNGAIDVSVKTQDANEVNTPITDAVKLAYADGTAKFLNFIAPKYEDADVIATGTKRDSYVFGKLSIFDAASAIALNDAAENTSAAIETVSEYIENYAGRVVPSVTVKLNRNQVLGTTNCNWAAEKWNTLCLPFDVTIRELSQQLGYAIVNVVDADATTTNNVAFKLQMVGTIKANTPFVVKTDVAQPNNTTLTFLNKTIVNATPSVDAGEGYKFVGVYEKKTLGGAADKDDSKLSFLRGNGDKWAHIGAGSTNSWNLVPMTAYIDLTPAVDAREVTFTMQEADGSTTVIRNIAGEAAAKLNAEGWYTINGIKLDNAPVEKGVYIHNGKKVVLK